MPLFRLPAHRARPSSVSAACADSLQWGTGCQLRGATCRRLSATCLQGWSKFYEFSFSDQRAGVDVISLGTKNGRAPQWEYLHGLLENAIYGGRIDNGHDVLVRRLRLAACCSTESYSDGTRATHAAGWVTPLRLLQGLQESADMKEARAACCWAQVWCAPT